MGEDLHADRGRPRDTGEVGFDPIRFLARGTEAVAPKGYKRKARPAAVTARLVRRPAFDPGAPKKKRTSGGLRREKAKPQKKSSDIFRTSVISPISGGKWKTT